MSIVDKLSFLRRKHSKTANEISDMTDIPLGTLNKILSGKTQNPAAHNLAKICHVFNVPMQYLLDDEMPDDCCMSAFSNGKGCIMLSERETELIYKLRRLDEHAKQSQELLLDIFCLHAPSFHWNAPEKTLLCFDSIADGLRGSYGDAFLIQAISAPLDAVTRMADFAIRVTGASLEPVYQARTVLAIKRIPPGPTQLGVFVLNHESLICKLQNSRGVQKLVAINVNMKCITLGESDEIQCLGTVIGSVRTFRLL